MIFIKKGTKWLAAGLGAVVLICGGSFFYQKQHFNRNIEINGVKVGGMSVAKATQKLKTTKLNNNVYLGKNYLLKVVTLPIQLMLFLKKRFKRFLTSNSAFSHLVAVTTIRLKAIVITLIVKTNCVQLLKVN
ncbi:hypothetical protein V8V50_02385 [Ligilactobacillus salivarius]